MFKDDRCHHILKLRGIPLHWKLLLSDVNKLIYIYIYIYIYRESCPWTFSFYVRHGKKTIYTSFIHS